MIKFKNWLSNFICSKTHGGGTIIWLEGDTAWRCNKCKRIEV